MSGTAVICARIRRTSCRIVAATSNVILVRGHTSAALERCFQPANRQRQQQLQLPYGSFPSAFRSFSTSPATTTSTPAAEGGDNKEEVIVPGIGKGKTSTGYVCFPTTVLGSTVGKLVYRRTQINPHVVIPKHVKIF